MGSSPTPTAFLKYVKTARSSNGRMPPFQGENGGSIPPRVIIEPEIRFKVHIYFIMKKCTRCKEDKSLDSFSKNKSKSDGLCNVCKECNRAYNKQHYLNNKETYKENAAERKRSIKEWASLYKASLKCERCGEDHPATIDFHHVDSSDKEKEVAVLVQEAYCIERILEEISKCIVLCSNCHRKHHWAEKHSQVAYVG